MEVLHRILTHLFFDRFPSHQPQGTDTALMTLKPEDNWDLEKVFVDTYKQEVSFQRQSNMPVRVALRGTFNPTRSATYYLSFHSLFHSTLLSSQFGFVLNDKSIIVDDVRVKGIGRSFDKLSESVHSEHKRLSSRSGGFTKASILSNPSCPRREVYFENAGRLPTPVVKLDQIKVGEKVEGPAILIDETQTILVEPQCEARICSESVLIAILYP